MGLGGRRESRETKASEEVFERASKGIEEKIYLLENLTSGFNCKENLSVLHNAISQVVFFNFRSSPHIVLPGFVLGGTNMEGWGSPRNMYTHHG